jgi:hypothetical protein
MRMCHICICVLPGCTIFFTLSHKRHDFRKKQGYGIWIVCLDFLYNVCLKDFSFLEEVSEIWSNMYISLQVKYPSLLSHFSESWNCSAYLKTNHIYKIWWIPIQWDWIVPRENGRRDGQTEDGRTNMTKLTIAFRNFANAPKNAQFSFNTPYNINTDIQKYIQDHNSSPSTLRSFRA